MSPVHPPHPFTFSHASSRLPSPRDGTPDFVLDLVRILFLFISFIHSFSQPLREISRNFHIAEKRKGKPKREGNLIKRRVKGERRRNDGRRKRIWKEGCEIGETKNSSRYSPRMPSWLLPFLDLRTDASRMS